MPPRESYARRVFLQIAGVDLSYACVAGEVRRRVRRRESTGVNDHDLTFTGGAGYGTLQVEFLMDYRLEGVYRTLEPLLGREARVQFNPYGSAYNANRPRQQFNVLIDDLPPVSQRVGRLSRVRMIWPITGPVGKSPSAYWTGFMTVGHHTRTSGQVVHGGRFSGTEDVQFGSIEDRVIPGGLVAGFSPVGQDVNVEVVEVSWRADNGDFDFRLSSTLDATSLANETLVAGPVVFPLVGSPTENGNTTWRKANVADPGWDVGLPVRLELWAAGDNPVP